MFVNENPIPRRPATIVRRLACVCAVVAAFALLTQSVAAQRFKTIDAKMEPRAARALRGQVGTAMRNAGAFQDGGKEKIDEYFKKEFFPRMTHTSSEAMAELGNSRETLIKVLRGATVPAAQEHLTQLTLGVMGVLARDSYHPAVRANATFVLGKLDQTYSGVGANAVEPVVLPAATNALLELLENEEFKGVKVHPSVKVAALQGLRRHCRFGLDPQYADRVNKAAMAVLAQEPSVLGVDRSVNDWMKCQAAGVLAVQFKAGPNAALHDALTALVADEEMSLEDRCCIVDLLDDMEYSAAAGDADVASMLVPLAALTRSVVSEGAERAQEFEDLVVGKAPAQPRRGFGGRNQPEGPKLERRQLLSCLVQIENGARAISKGLADEKKQQLKELTDSFQKVLTISKDTKESDLDLMGEVIRLEDTVNNLVASWLPAAPAAEPSAEEFGE